MNPNLQTLHFAGSLKAVVPDRVVEARVGYLPWVLGENLAGQVDAWVMEQAFGYYPALDFFRPPAEAVDPALLLLVDEVAGFCSGYARREIRRRLSRGFSGVRVGRVQSLAFVLPHVRPSREGAPAALATHYAPNRVKVDLELTSIRNTPLQQPEQLARIQIMQWLGDVLERVVITDLRQLAPS